MLRKSPTLAARIAATSARKAVALTTFEAAASALEATADEHRSLADEAQAEAARLVSLAKAAESDADHALRAASKVRDLTA